MVCDGHIRAMVAASILRGMGYTNVAVLDGGYPAWSARGYASEIGSPFEIDYGEPPWLARFLQDFPHTLGPLRRLPVPASNRLASAPPSFPPMHYVRAWAGSRQS